jgi:hypothetical protein
MDLVMFKISGLMMMFFGIKGRRNTNEEAVLRLNSNGCWNVMRTNKATSTNAHAQTSSSS